MQPHDILVAILALGGVLALIGLTQRLLRHGGALRPASGGRLRLVESLAIDPRRRLVLAQLDGRDVLLLTGGASDVLLPWPAHKEDAA
jgi:flagellar protein FliO/FliZ